MKNYKVYVNISMMQKIAMLRKNSQQNINTKTAIANNRIPFIYE